jgi:hypothetical protein
MILPSPPPLKEPFSSKIVDDDNYDDNDDDRETTTASSSCSTTTCTITRGFGDNNNNNKIDKDIYQFQNNTDDKNDFPSWNQRHSSHQQQRRPKPDVESLDDDWVACGILSFLVLLMIAILVAVLLLPPEDTVLPPQAPEQQFTKQQQHQPSSSSSPAPNVCPLAVSAFSVTSLLPSHHRRHRRQNHKNPRVAAGATRDKQSNPQHPFLARTTTTTTTTATSGLQSSSSNNNSNEDNDQNSLLNRAVQLRQEAALMEQKLRNSKTPATAASPPPAVPKYTTFKDSKWTIKYRFSSQPIVNPNEAEKDDETREQGAVTNVFYSGRFVIHLQSDGYSNLVGEPVFLSGTSSSISNNNKTNNKNNNRQIAITKIWGWDQETSNEDQKDYVLWSVDVTLPATDPSLPQQSQRFYFQARVVTAAAAATGGSSSSSGELSLQEGTVTVKQGVSQRTRGVWGLFNVAGILTEFKYVGDFVAQPVAVVE